MVLILGGLGWSKCEMRLADFSFPHSQPTLGTMNYVIPSRGFGTGRRWNSRKERKSAVPGVKPAPFLQKLVVSVEIAANHRSLEGSNEAIELRELQAASTAKTQRQQQSPNSGRKADGELSEITLP